MRGIIGHESHTTDSITDMESTFINELLGEKKMSRFNTPVRILIHSYRHRLVDSDNVSGKAAIDALVHAGILADDSPKQVTEVSFRQTKIKTSEEEKTEIIIQECHKKEGV